MSDFLMNYNFIFGAVKVRPDVFVTKKSKNYERIRTKN